MPVYYPYLTSVIIALAVALACSGLLAVITYVLWPKAG